MKRIHCYTDPKGQTHSGLTLTEVKKRIRKEGGSGYTQHFDRDGSFQESTPITLGNNARTTYRAEYNHSRKFNTRQAAHQTASESSSTTLDVPAIINEVVAKAKAENLGELDHARLMQLLGPMLGEDAYRITYDWYDRTLCYIQGRLFNEYRGMKRECDRRDAIINWKNEKRKEYEEKNI